MSEADENGGKRRRDGDGDEVKEEEPPEKAAKIDRDEQVNNDDGSNNNTIETTTISSTTANGALEASSIRPQDSTGEAPLLDTNEPEAHNASAALNNSESANSEQGSNHTTMTGIPVIGSHAEANPHVTDAISTESSSANEHVPEESKASSVEANLMVATTAESSSNAPGGLEESIPSSGPEPSAESVPVNNSAPPDSIMMIDRTGVENPVEQAVLSQPIVQPPKDVSTSHTVVPSNHTGNSQNTNSKVISHVTHANVNPTPASNAPSGRPMGGAVVDNTPVNPTALATLINPDQLVEERGIVPALYVGKVIGKGGEMIRDLQARSGARIDVDQNVAPGHPRVITYRGTRRTVDFAKQLVAILSQEGVTEDHLPLGEAKRKILSIPSQAVGKVIGRGGEMIKELQSRSQAKIQVDHTGGSGASHDQKQVTITGTEPSVIKAEEMVNFLVANPLYEGMAAIALLVEDKLRGGTWGSGPPYANLPNHGVNMQAGGGMGGHHGAAAYSADYRHQAPPVGSYMGTPAATGVPPNSYLPHHQQHQAQPAYNPAYGVTASVGGVAAGAPTEVDIVYTQKQYMGRIIGQKGVTINDLQRRSACDIQINQDVAPGQDCEITIRGTRQGIDYAKQMISEIIATGPHHPYAGGADSYGAGAGAAGFQHQQQQPQQQAYGQSYAYPYQAPAQAYTAPYDQSAYPANYFGYQAPPQPYTYGQTPAYGNYGGPPTAAAPTPMPPVSDWKVASAPDGKVYYYNERTGATQWDKPAEMP